MNSEKGTSVGIITAVVVIVLLLVTSITAFSFSSSSYSLLPLANSQPSDTVTGPFPTLLIHGYASNALVWQEWEESLTDRGIITHAITFSGTDECGSAQEHAAELIDIVEDFKTDTRSWETR